MTNLGNKKVFLLVNGCHENHMDASLLSKYISNDSNLSICEHYKEADIIFFLGCQNTQHMEDETKELINFLKRNKKNDAELIILGCISKANPEYSLVDNKYFSDLKIDDIDDLHFDCNCNTSANYLYKPNDTIISHEVKKRKEKIFTSPLNGNNYNDFCSFLCHSGFNLMHKYKYFIESHINSVTKSSYCIKISTGCLGNCSYCIIRKSRGNVRSKPIDRVVEEFKEGLDTGCRSFTFMGTDIADYGKDFGSGLSDLLKKILEIPEDFKLRLRNVNPRWLISAYDDLFSLLSDGRINYILSPIQSGSNRILELMNRGYNIKDLLNSTEKIKSKCPSLVLQTQIMVGFPTETESEFKESFHISKNGDFTYIDVFRYSDRLGTKAYSIKPKISQDIIMRRYSKILCDSLFKHPIKIADAIYQLNY